MASWTKRQGEVTSHSRNYGEELQRSIFVQIASAIGDLDSAIGIIPIKLSNPVMSMASWTKRQGEVTSHSRNYGEELQRSIFVQIASAIGDLDSAIGIRCSGCQSLQTWAARGTYNIKLTPETLDTPPNFPPKKKE